MGLGHLINYRADHCVKLVMVKFKLVALNGHNLQFNIQWVISLAI